MDRQMTGLIWIRQLNGRWIERTDGWIGTDGYTETDREMNRYRWIEMGIHTPIKG